ncbi:MAG: proline--tRNA ligase [Elusimicrobia bacterium GWC2_65_9]|nr:MAG: proline--tRNA ligase [Elusimicrobia bacterium GWA2_66_18]OGR71029.1 MAG: proline--tRNA ligase [Elusimicrobia bacterium GWC2_65_9]
MKLSRYLLPTLREAPSDADNVSARLMQRAGMIRKVASGIYDWLPLGLRVLRKVERIVREEMDAVGGQEILLPVIQPKSLWKETGRWDVYGKELLRLKDRKDAEFCFAPTAEEVVTDLVRREVRSWRQLPTMLYQFGLKFRDEIRPRFGVMRAREFLMKDAYSFHADEADASLHYQKIYEAYRKIFVRCGLKFKPVEAQSGAIGGSTSHEFMVLAETGEETIVSCSKCDYGANLERAEVKDHYAAPEASSFKSVTKFETQDKTSVAEVAKLVSRPLTDFLKTQLYMINGHKPVIALMRGDHEIHEAKLAAAVGSPALQRANEAQYRQVMGCKVGYGGPQGHPDAPVYADFAAKSVLNGITGANQDGLHVDHFNISRDLPALKGYFDLRCATPEDPCPRCGSRTVFYKGIEVGHTFKLGTKYSAVLKAEYLDERQKSRVMVMGCYGIGVSRVVAAAIEQGHDKDGILWPPAISPFHVALVVLDEADDARVRPAADSLVASLESAGIEVLEDDRDGKPGVKFKDIDLIGIPHRLVLSKKTLDAGEVEYKRRGVASFERWKLDEASDLLGALLAVPAL